MKHVLQFWFIFSLLILSLTGLTAQTVLLVTNTDPANIGPGDAQVSAALQSRGFTVEVKGGPTTPVTPADANGKQFIYISSSANDTTLGATFRDVTVPVIVCESLVFDDMQMTGPTRGTDFGFVNNASQIDILLPGHPLAGPYTGTISVTTANTTMRWGNPANTADKVALHTGTTNRHAIFVYDTGDQMVGLQAPSTRIGFFYNDYTILHPTTEGLALFNYVIDYADSVANVCNAFSGTIKVDQTPVSLAGGSATITATPQGDAVVPAGYAVAYVLTTGSNLVIQQVDTVPSFTVTAAGTYSVHTIVYNPDPASSDFLDVSTIQLGVTTAIDVITQISLGGICASLDLAGSDAVVVACTADAGTLTIDMDPVELSGGTATVSATPDGNIVVPTGYSVIYVLTSGTNLVIEQVNTSPTFTVADTGDYTIHTLVFNNDSTSSDFLDLSVVQPGVTTGVDVLTLINANGICASLDVAGAGVHVQAPPCTADAGTLTIDMDPVELSGGTATVSATPDGNIFVPTGYSVIYVLTSGPTLVIEQVNTSPTFTVADTGDYTIHTLVFNNDSTSSDFLDLSIVQFGVTTGVDVLNLVVANGICASLDVAGAGVHVQEPPCTADAGTLTIDFDPVSLVGGSATVSATPDGNIIVPAGYSVIYVLTSGPTLVIEQVNTSPTFTVADTGDYTIHTLVFNNDSTSSDFLDLSIVQFGVTTGVDVLNLVVANGICASLDVAGAGVHVQSCTADAGTLTIDFGFVSLVGGTATVSATPDGNISVPAGFSVIYVLTSGPNLVIEQVNTIPTFSVTDTGDYTIHTLVFNNDSTSSDFLDLSIVQPGVTTGVDVLNLVIANGICASLDVAGAGVHVQSCTADAGTLTIDVTPVILTGGSAMVSATPDSNAFVPAGYSVLYVLTYGTNLVIEQVNTSPVFTVTSAGDYTIHTLVYNPDSTSSDFLDLSVVQPGVTTGVDVVNLITTNGICASLDVAGAGVHVMGMMMGQLISLYPNPANQFISLAKLDPNTPKVEIYILGLDGRIVKSQVLDFSRNASQQIDIGELPEGMYLLRARNFENNEETMIKFWKE